METLMTILQQIDSFIFNWTTYFWGIPVWFIMWIFITKIIQGKVIVSDLLPILILSLINPACYIMSIFFIIIYPILLIVAKINWDKIKDRKIF